MIVSVFFSRRDGSPAWSGELWEMPCGMNRTAGGPGPRVPPASPLEERKVQFVEPLARSSRMARHGILQRGLTCFS